MIAVFEACVVRWHYINCTVYANGTETKRSGAEKGGGWVTPSGAYRKTSESSSTCQPNASSP